MLVVQLKIVGNIYFKQGIPPFKMFCYGDGLTNKIIYALMHERIIYMNLLHHAAIGNLDMQEIYI